MIPTLSKLLTLRSLQSLDKTLAREYSLLAGLVTAGATAATSKAAETVGQTAAELALGKEEDDEKKSEADRGASFAPIADILRDAARKIEKLEDARSRDQLIGDLARHHEEMGKIIAKLGRATAAKGANQDDGPQG